MLYTKPKKEALEIHKKAVDKYNDAFAEMESFGKALYKKRGESIQLLKRIESFINSIANRPKEFEKTISSIQTERKKFHETEMYAAKALESAIKSSAGAAAGAAGGVAVASLAPSAAMWVATTFGTASTGTAISTLSGAAAAKAALAWLGGGALSAGGAGVAGGQALLALAGPIGWSIAGGATAVAALTLGHKNHKIADEALEEAKKVTIAGAELRESCVKAQDLDERTDRLYKDLQLSLDECHSIDGADYSSLSTDWQYKLGSLVNNSLSLAMLLNETV